MTDTRKMFEAMAVVSRLTLEWYDHCPHHTHKRQPWLEDSANVIIYCEFKETTLFVIMPCKKHLLSYLEQMVVDVEWKKL